jgi:GNAT superfamily N-acetyltransferase
MKFSMLYQKLKRNLDDYGVFFTIKKIVGNIFKPIYFHNVYRVYGIVLENARSVCDSNINFDFVVLNKNHHGLIHQIEHMEEWLQGKLIDKLSAGGLCVAAVDNGRVAAFNLVAFGNVYLPLVEMNKQLKPDEAWSEQITVKKDYRKRGLASEIRHQVFNVLKQQGIKRLYGAALVENTGSLKLAARVGFTELKDIYFYKVLGRRIWKHKGLD